MRICRQNNELWLSLHLRHPSSSNVALNATRTVVNSQGPCCNSSKTVWQSFNCFILERGYYNWWRVPSFYHRAQSSGNGLQKASTSRTDPLQNILLTFLPFVMKYLEISKPNYREGEGGSIRAQISFLTTMRKCQLAVRPRIWVTIKKNIYEQDVSLETVAIGIILSITPVL